MSISESDQPRFVFPGDDLGASEEFTPGPGTYEENGKIYALGIGLVSYDPEELTVRLEPRTGTPLVLRTGQTVIGVVIDIYGPIAIIKVLKVVNELRAISSVAIGSVHISKVSDGFVPDMGRAFKIGDAIRAKIIQTEPSLQLSTAGTNYGVIYSLCGGCRMPMVKRDNDCYCPNCDRVWEKKVAGSYRTGAF